MYCLYIAYTQEVQNCKKSNENGPTGTVCMTYTQIVSVSVIPQPT